MQREYNIRLMVRIAYFENLVFYLRFVVPQECLPFESEGKNQTGKYLFQGGVVESGSGFCVFFNMSKNVKIFFIPPKELEPPSDLPVIF